MPRRLTPEHRANIAAGLRNRPLSEGHRAHLDELHAAKRGKPVPPGTRAKISRTLTGRKQSPELVAKRRAIATKAAASPTWVGEAVSYNRAHNRARLALPLECAHADATCKGRLEVALRHDAPPELIRTSARGHLYFFGDDPLVGYMRLCASHHRRQDGNFGDHS